MKQVNVSIHYDPLNRDAIVLRNDIVAAGGFEDESIREYLHRVWDLSLVGTATIRDSAIRGRNSKESARRKFSTTNIRASLQRATIMRQPPHPYNAFQPGGPPPLQRERSPRCFLRRLCRYSKDRDDELEISSHGEGEAPAKA